MKAQLAVTRPHHILKRALKHDVRHLIRVILARILGYLMVYLDRLDASRRSYYVSLHLRLNAAIECAEEKYCLVDGLANGEMAVVAEDDDFVAAEGFGDGCAFVFLECYATVVEAD